MPEKGKRLLISLGIQSLKIREFTETGNFTQPKKHICAHQKKFFEEVNRLFAIVEILNDEYALGYDRDHPTIDQKKALKREHMIKCALDDAESTIVAYVDNSLLALESQITYLLNAQDRTSGLLLDIEHTDKELLFHQLNLIISRIQIMSEDFNFVFAVNDDEVKKQKKLAQKERVSFEANEDFIKFADYDYQVMINEFPEFFSTPEKIDEWYQKLLHQVMINNYGFNYKLEIQFDEALLNEYKCLREVSEQAAEKLKEVIPQLVFRIAKI